MHQGKRGAAAWAAGVVAALCAGAASAAGIGVPPQDEGAYTPGLVGTSPLLSPATPGYFSQDGAEDGCDWVPIYGDRATRNLAYPEANSTYWQASPPLNIAAGTRIDVAGTFPNARFSAITVYDSQYAPLGQLDDWQLQPAAGSAPFLGQTQPNPGAPREQAYAAHIVFAASPAQPEPNTLYVSPDAAGGKRVYLLYRVYVPYGATASGDVPLPQLSIGGQAFSTHTATAACQNLLSQVAQNTLYNLSLKLGPLAALGSRDTAFKVYQGGGIPGLNVGLNSANRYMSANTSLPAGTLFIVRGKAPQSTTVSGGSTAQVRYWSVCQNGAGSEVIACVGDFQAEVDKQGYYHVIVSGGLHPAYADTRHGFNWMPFGPSARGAVIYRQMLAEADFAGAIGSSAMGDYQPQIAYCSVARFEAAAALGGSAEQVYQACAAAPQ